MGIHDLRHLMDELFHRSRDCLFEFFMNLGSDAGDRFLRNTLDKRMDPGVLHEDGHVRFCYNPELHPWDFAQNSTK